MNSYKFSVDDKRATSLIAQLGCPFSCFFCLTPENTIVYDNKIQHIDKVTVEKKVFTGESWQYVQNTFKRSIQEKIYYIKPKGLFPLELTGNHEIKTERGWTKAENIRKNDKLFFPFVPYDDFDSIDIYEVLKNVKFKNRKQNVKQIQGNYTSDDILAYINEGISDLQISKKTTVNRKTIAKIRNNKFKKEKIKLCETKLVCVDDKCRLSGSKYSIDRYIKLNYAFCQIVGYY